MNNFGFYWRHLSDPPDVLILFGIVGVLAGGFWGLTVAVVGNGNVLIDTTIGAVIGVLVAVGALVILALIASDNDQHR